MCVISDITLTLISECRPRKVLSNSFKFLSHEISIKVATQKHLTTSKRFQLTQRKRNISSSDQYCQPQTKWNINMNTVFVSLVLTMVLAAAPTNSKDTRDRRQTRQQCEKIVGEKTTMIINTISGIMTSCTESCILCVITEKLEK